MLGNRTLGDFLKIQDLCLKPACADSFNSSSVGIVFGGVIVDALSLIQSLGGVFVPATVTAVEPSLTRLI
jgi:hypothetical protein